MRGVTCGATTNTEAPASHKDSIFRCATSPPPITTTRLPSKFRYTGYNILLRVYAKIIRHSLCERAHLRLLRHDFRSETLFPKAATGDLSYGSNHHVVFKRCSQRLGMAKLMGEIKQHPNLLCGREGNGLCLSIQNLC